MMDKAVALYLLLNVIVFLILTPPEYDPAVMLKKKMDAWRERRNADS